MSEEQTAAAESAAPAPIPAAEPRPHIEGVTIDNDAEWDEAGNDTSDDMDAAPIAENEQVADDQQDEQAPLEEEQEQEAPPEEGEAETFEFEHDGEQYSVPKPLEELFMKRADYTQKTQEVAREREAVIRDREIVNSAAKRTVEMQNADYRMRQISSELEEYQGVDWRLEAQENPEGAQRHQVLFNELEREKRQLEGEIGGLKQQEQAAQQQEYAQRVESGLNYGKENIPGWSQELATQIGTFMRDQGLSDEFVQENFGPEFVKISHLAYVGANLLKNQNDTTAPAPKQVKKVGKVQSSKATSVADADIHEATSDEEYFAIREAQLKRRG